MLLTAVLLTLPSSALAQDPSRTYLLVGGGMALRQSGDGNGPELVQTRDWLPMARLGVGFRVTPRLAVEFDVGVEGSQSFPWRFQYARRNELVTDRDFPVMSYARIMPGCAGRVCPDIVVGGGFTFHRAGSVPLEHCDFYFTACEPIRGRNERSNGGTLEFTVGGGADLLIRASPRLSVGPSFRVHAVDRRENLVVSYDHRSPRGGDGVVAMAGVVVRIGIRR